MVSALGTYLIGRSLTPPFLVPPAPCAAAVTGAIQEISPRANISCADLVTPALRNEVRRLRAEAAALGREHASLGAQHASLVLEKARQVCDDDNDDGDGCDDHGDGGDDDDYDGVGDDD